MPYDTESKSRNADFILIARKGDTTTIGAKGPVKLKNPWAEGPSILRTLPHYADFIFIAREGDTTTLGPKGRCPLSVSEHNLPPSGGHNPRGEAPSTFPSEPFEPFEPSEPSRPYGNVV